MVTLKIPSDGSQTSLNYSSRSSCNMNLELKGSADWLSYNVRDNSIDFTADNNDKGKERSVYLTPVVNGKECKSNKIQVIQEAGEAPAVIDCIRGTDNGNDWVNNKQVAHPMNLCAKAGIDEDSMYVDSLYYGDTPSSSSIINVGGPWIEVENWLRIRRETGGWYGGDKIVYSFDENRTGSVRRTSFILSTTDSDVTPEAPPAKTYGKTNACSWWQIDVQQVPCGYYWCGDHSYTQEPVPCSQGCSSSSTYVCRETSQCNCEDEGFQVNGHSEDYTEIKSACEAGNYAVSITKDASFSIEGDGATINGRTQGNVSAGNVNIVFTAVQDGQEAENAITFTHDDESIVLTLKRNCSSQCDTCEGANITATDSIELEGNSGSTAVITYTSNNCEIDVKNNDPLEFSYSTAEGIITVTARTDNTSGTVRRTTFELLLKNGTSCKTIQVTQKVKSEECQHPGATVDIMIKGNRMPSGYVSFYLTDNVVGENCKTWLVTEGDAAIAQEAGYPVSLGYYEYGSDSCTDITFEKAVGANYCHINGPGSSTCNGQVREITESSSIRYYLYGYNGTDFVNLGNFNMPTPKQCQDGIEGEQGSYIFYVLK